MKQMVREYVLTDEEMAELLAASKPVPYIVVGGIPPRSAQENANDAWRRLGEKHGFNYLTVRPVAGQDQHHFTAEEAPATAEVQS